MAVKQMEVYRAEIVLARNAIHPSPNTNDFSEYVPIYGVKLWRDALAGPGPVLFRPLRASVILWDGTEEQLEEIRAEALEIKGKLE
jgi:hypothetical protein